MTPLLEALHRLVAGHDLTALEVEGAVGQIMRGEAEEAQLGAFLMGLRQKGETPEELLGCARALRAGQVAVRPRRSPLVDTCGTGGDGAATLNISTLAALVVAGCGLPVAKHGNRSVSSQCGSADLLEALGVTLLKEPESAAACIDELSFGFLFAPHFHPATARVAAARRSLKLRTLFNLVGPLVNPAGASVQLIGVYAPEWLEGVARTAAELGSQACLVVHGAGGMDELTLHGPARAVLWKHGEFRTLELGPEDAGLPPGRLDDIRGGEPVENAARSERILQGEPDAARHAVALNAGACLWLADQASSLREGAALAAEALRSGAGWKVVEALRSWSG